MHLQSRWKNRGQVYSPGQHNQKGQTGPIYETVIFKTFTIQWWKTGPRSRRDNPGRTSELWSPRDRADGLERPTQLWLWTRRGYWEERCPGNPGYLGLGKNTPQVFKRLVSDEAWDHLPGLEGQHSALCLNYFPHCQEKIPNNQS